MARRKRRTKAQMRRAAILEVLLLPWRLVLRILINLVVVPIGMVLGAGIGIALMAASTALAFLIGTVIVMALLSL